MPGPIGGPPGRSGPEREFRIRPPFSTAPTLTAASPNSDRVAGGATITLTGTNFGITGDTPVVTFGGAAATAVTVVNSTTITCVSPAVAAGLVDIIITVGGQTATLTESFTYYTSVINSIAPVYGTFAGGTSVTISGYNFVASSTVKFGGTAATSVIIIDDETISCITPNHSTGHVDVTVTEPGLGGAVATLQSGFQFTLLTRGDDIRKKPGIVIRDVLNNTPNTCTFVVDGLSNAPQSGEEIRITDANDGNRLLFAGNIQTIDQEYDGIPGPPGRLNWKCTATDFTWLLNKMMPFGAFVKTSATDIVKALVSNYAPGFTTSHVQTNLAKVNATFDGRDDLASCLTKVAAAIGGGHWYVDYNRDVHFFHISPTTNVVIPSTNMRLNTANGMGAPTLAAGGLLPWFWTSAIGYVVVRVAFVYDNGAESAPGPVSYPLALDGMHYLNISNIPVGSAVGGHTCVKRRIYAGYPTLSRDFYHVGDVTDNATTSTDFPLLTTIVYRSNAGVLSVFPVIPNVDVSTNSWPPAITRYVIAPPGPSGVSLSGYNTTDILRTDSLSAVPLDPLSPYYQLETDIRKFSYTPGTYSYQVVCLYRDGTQSLPGPVSSFATDGIHAIQFTGIPTGPTVNGVDVAARIIIGQFSGIFMVYALVPDNTSTSALWLGPYQPIIYNTPYKLPANYTGGAIPVWPNPDGPSLETTDPPDAITYLNTDVLNDPQFTVSSDLSQVRNRVRVYSGGSNLTKAAALGARTLTVSECASFSPMGGVLVALGQTFNFDGVSALTGAGTLFLTSSLTVALPLGTVISSYFTADDTVSQIALAKVELDVNGNPTDGVHEYTVTDTSLTTYAQVYMRAYAELELFGRPILTVKYSTRDPKSRSGAIVHVDLNNPPCHGDFLIQDVTIDQIHDESNTLMPRYNVTASSVKFNLNDLLLQLASGVVSASAAAGGAQVTALVSGGTASGSTSIATGTYVSPAARRSFAMAWRNASTAVGMETVGLSGPGFAASGTGTEAQFIDERRAWSRSTNTSTTVSRGVNTTNNPGLCRYDHDPYLAQRIRAGDKTANVRIFCGWVRQAPFNSGADTPPNSDVSYINQAAGQGGDGSSNRRMIMFRYSSARGTNWELIVSDGIDSNSVTAGGTQYTVNTNSVYLVGNEYFMELTVDHVTQSVTWKITNVTTGDIRSGTQTMPSTMFGNPYAWSSTNLACHIFNQIYSTATPFTYFDWGGLYAEWGRV